jgi:hypothetical protein
MDREFSAITGAFTAEQLADTLARHAPEMAVWITIRNAAPVSRVVITADRVELQ